MAFNIFKHKHRFYNTLIAASIAFASLAVFSEDLIPEEELKIPRHFVVPPKLHDRSEPSLFISPPFPPFIFRELQLSEFQEDKLFQLSIAQAPAIYEKAKLIHHLRDDLDKQMAASSIDTNAIYAIAEKLAKANSDLMVLQIKNELKLREILTPLQRKNFNRHKFADFSLLVDQHRELASLEKISPPEAAPISCN